MEGRRKVINESLRIFQDVESLRKIQMRSGNGNRHYISLCKVKILIVRSMDEQMNVSEVIDDL